MGPGRLHPATRAGIAAGVLACFLLLACVAAAAVRNFESPASSDPQQQFTLGSPQRADTPNDPEYDRAEPDDEDGPPSVTNLYDERFDLFGFPSALTSSTAKYLDGPHAGQSMVSGYNAAGAWKLERGRPDVTVAVLDTGIKWDREGLRLQVHLNRGELPVPKDGAADCSYDCNGDGVFNVADYANDPRVSPTAGPHGSSQLDAEDLIATFSDGTDGDGNGFVDDIAGWDFFDNDNDPYDASSYFAAKNHGSGRAHEVVERGNDGAGALGVCPHCQLMPIRTWDTFVSDGNTFAMGILYATDNGVKVIEGANGSTYHSAFAEQASNYAYEHGVVQTFSGDDLNTGNHNYPANYGHAMLIQGTVPDTVGLGSDAGQLAEGRAGLCAAFNPPAPPVGCPGTTTPVKTYFRGANTTQFGGKSSISMEGSTGSENTGKSSGAAAIVISAALDHSGGAIELRPDETRAILEQTAERVTTGNTAGTGVPDPAASASAPPEDQWTSHFGWGRVNLGAAVAVARSGQIPPEAAIDAPDWYAPVSGPSIDVTGLARARFATAGQLHWKLQWGTGQAPASWNTVHEGDSSGQVTDFGGVDLAQVRAALASYNPPPDSGGPTLSAVSPNPFRNEFTVRLIVTGEGIPTPGIDRRVFTSLDDPSLRPGFPRRLGTGGEAPIRYGDINGDNVQELIVPTEDGSVHAYEPDGSELPGWPVHTMIERPGANHGAAAGFAALTAQGTPPREPPRGPVIGDLDGDGRPEVIDTAGTHLYAWEPDGSLRPGFPVESDLSQCVPAAQSQPLHHPKCGFLASPAVGRFQGPGQPQGIVVPGLDGLLYGFDGDGHALPHFPLRLVDPSVPPDQQMIAESINEPAIGDLNGDGRDDVVVATNETYDATPPSSQTISGLFAEALSNALANAAGGSSRVYAVDGATGQFLPGWPIKLNGAIQSTLPLIGPGQNPAIAGIGGQTRVIASTTGSATIGVYDTAGNQVRAVQQGAYGPGSDATDRSGTINLFESASVGDVTGAGGLDIVKYGLSLNDLTNLLLTGQNTPYNHLIGAYDAQSGAPLPAFPRITDDFQFLSSSDIAKVQPGASNQVLAGTGLGLLHAYDGVTGLDAPGFPKVTGGWLFAPAALSDDRRMADITREGFLFQWNLPDLPKCQSEWPSFRHDQQQSGNYDRDGTQPYRPTGMHADGGALVFTAPGDDYGCGAAQRYQVATADHRITPTSFASARRLGGAPEPRAAGTQQRYAPPSHARFVAIRAVDEAGNVGWVADHDYGAAGRASGPCSNPIAGDGRANRLRGTTHGDRILGRGGRDKILGFAGDDCLIGGKGDDRLYGGRGRDRLRGNGGRDRLVGGPGPDLLAGGRSDDRLLIRGGGRDVAACGVGRDVAIVDRGDHVRGCEIVRRGRRRHR